MSLLCKCIHAHGILIVFNFFSNYANRILLSHCINILWIYIFCTTLNMSSPFWQAFIQKLAMKTLFTHTDLDFMQYITTLPITLLFMLTFNLLQYLLLGSNINRWHISTLHVLHTCTANYYNIHCTNLTNFSEMQIEVVIHLETKNNI